MPRIMNFVLNFGSSEDHFLTLICEQIRVQKSHAAVPLRKISMCVVLLGMGKEVTIDNLLLRDKYILQTRKPT